MSCVSDPTLTPPPPSLPVHQIILMTFSWISFVLYFALVIVLIRTRDYILSSPFFKIVIFNAIVDFATFFHLEMSRARKYRFWSIFNNNMPQLFIDYSYLSMRFLPIVMYLSYILFAMNRFLAFYSPFRYKKLCTNGTVILGTILVWICAFLLLLPGYIFIKADMKMCILTSGALQLLPGDVFTYGSIVGVIVTGMVMTICLPLYCMAAILAKKASLVSEDKSQRLERKLLICSILTFIPLVFECIRSVVQLYGNLTRDRQIIVATGSIWFALVGVMTSAQFWTILFISPRVRRVMFGRLMGKKPTISVQVQPTRGTTNIGSL